MNIIKHKKIFEKGKTYGFCENDYKQSSSKLIFPKYDVRISPDFVTISDMAIIGVNHKIVEYVVNVPIGSNIFIIESYLNEWKKWYYIKNITGKNKEIKNYLDAISVKICKKKGRVNISILDYNNKSYHFEDSNKTIFQVNTNIIDFTLQKKVIEKHLEPTEEKVFILAICLITFLSGIVIGLSLVMPK